MEGNIYHMEQKSLNFRYNHPTRAVLIAPNRSGGTFLAQCLSSHPQIFCDRGEPLHPKSCWRQAGLTPQQIVKLLTEQHFYLVSMFKMNPAQLAEFGGLKALEAAGIKKVILLWRNPIRMAISGALTYGSDPEPAHSFESITPRKKLIDPVALIEQVGRYVEEWTALHWDVWDATPHIIIRKLEYSDLEIEGAPGFLKESVERSIVEFLDISERPIMRAYSYRLHAAPLPDMIENWPEVEAALLASPFAGYMETLDE
jgi:hypothetical protein